MTAEFWPESPAKFVKALRSEGIPVPKDSGKEIVVDRRTRFRFDTIDGTDRFKWSDPELENEWNGWVAQHS